MTAAKTTVKQQKEQAHTLYLEERHSPQEIAQQVGTTVEKVNKWIADGQWDKMRKSLTTTKAEQLAFLYDILARMTAEGRRALDDDDPATQPDYDGISKIARAIERLEKETNVGEMIQTGIFFLQFMKKEDIEVARLFNTWFMAFIQEQMSKT